MIKKYEQKLSTKLSFSLENCHLLVILIETVIICKLKTAQHCLILLYIEVTFCK